ncbi:hypothetical protein SS50377_21677 [Spironucleus salmonicida]|uniref:Uncharacterized protein n=1 Tax=Spironucleus salmonicida TaxID=348837 RepID=A0A9P8LXI8_9EUKA|nr:hypothetical protein SS50377_21677 [Spironucleus salmonicida]
MQHSASTNEDRLLFLQATESSDQPALFVACFAIHFKTIYWILYEKQQHFVNRSVFQNSQYQDIVHIDQPLVRHSRVLYTGRQSIIVKNLYIWCVLSIAVKLYRVACNDLAHDIQ